MNKVLGICACPLPWCKEPGAEVRESEKGGVPYLICDACGTMVRTTSRKGKAGLRAMAVPGSPAPVKDKQDAAPPPPAKTKQDAAPPAPAKTRRFGFA